MQIIFWNNPYYKMLNSVNVALQQQQQQQQQKQHKTDSRQCCTRQLKMVEYTMVFP